MLLAVVTAIVPIAFVLDLLRPLLLERPLLERIAREFGGEATLLSRADYVAIVLAALMVASLVGLAAAGHREALVRIALVVWSTLLVLVVFEISLRATGRPYVFRPGVSVTFDPDPAFLPGIEGPSNFTVNRRGMRGPEWDDEAFKVLTVGGSTTINTYLDDTETWPWMLMTLLQERLQDSRIWVGNVGKSGHDTLHHIEILERLPEVREVDLILVLAGVNDFNHALRFDETMRRGLAPSRVFDLGGQFSPILPYFKQTHLYLHARALFKRSAAARFVEDSQGRAYSLRRRARQAATKDYPLPPLEPLIEEYGRNLSRIAEICRDLDARCVFLTQPTSWQDPMPDDLEALTWFRPIGDTGRALSSADLARAMAAYNDKVLEVCRVERLDCLDLAAAIPKSALAFYDDAHVTEAGAAIVAETVAEYLLERPGLLDRDARDRDPG